MLYTINLKKTLVFGPWVGEFGWELFECQSIIRKFSEKFDSVICSSLPANKILYGFLFTAPNYIQDPQNQSWKKYQNRLYSVLQSIIEEGIQKKEFLDINPSLLMKAIGGLFHQLLINNDDNLTDEDLELMLMNFLNPK